MQRLWPYSRMRLGVIQFFALASFAAFGGCGDREQTATYPVTGTVRFQDGAVAKDMTVWFRATNHTPPVSARGTTDEDGKFSLHAAEGENAAIVVPAIPRDLDNVTPAQRHRIMHPVDQIFRDFERSPLKFQVTTDAAKNQFDITIWPPRR